jgi:hypothetical protein
MISLQMCINRAGESQGNGVTMVTTFKLALLEQSNFMTCGIIVILVATNAMQCPF